MKRTRECSVVLFMFLVFAASAAHAVDGVIQLNQARALAGDPSLADAPGFPITIRQSGSYRLTSDLVLFGIEGTEELDAINVMVTNVTIDLNGFAILGPASCTLDAGSIRCEPQAGGDGIDATARSQVVVRNGFVRGFAGRCIALSSYSTVEDVSVSSCGQGGVDVQFESQVRHANVSFSGDDGIRGSEGGVIVQNCSVFRTEGDGIDVGGGSLVIDNRITLTNGFGLRMTNGGYRGNVLRNTFGGTITGDGLEIGANICAGSTTCP